MSVMDFMSDKEMSFNHWRFRLLHWVHGVNPSNPDESILSSTFYTHYCPLFHYTNLLVLFLWAIIIYKVGKWIGWNFAQLVKKCIERIPDRPIPDETLHALRAQREKRYFIESIRKKRWDNEDFGTFWMLHSYYFDYMTKEEVEAEFNKLKEEEVQKAAYRAKMQKQMVIWVNFSQVLVKGLLYLFYGALALGVVWGLWLYALPVLFWFCGCFISFFGWLISIRVTDVLNAIAGVCLATVLVAVPSYIIYKFRNTAPMKASNDKVSFVFALGADIGIAIFDTVVGSFKAIIEFCKVFYEENCPTIKIKD